ncbi:hypothetical protein CIPAW_05G203900 [Carya illinoinensis]|uniref:Uncharacterized protein n=1 Tax=Carya illinoinensis TaxID=32201 RepID=A0A8T1QKE5_CARIL|nr:hypothetical protein CIPAW_05G203900 [Carya illinoinensis]
MFTFIQSNRLLLITFNHRRTNILFPRTNSTHYLFSSHNLPFMTSLFFLLFMTKPLVNSLQIQSNTTNNIRMSLPKAFLTIITWFLVNHLLPTLQLTNNQRKAFHRIIL